jgi:hypothetical protein
LVNDHLFLGNFGNFYLPESEISVFFLDLF